MFDPWTEVVMLYTQLANELAPDIRVNGVAPSGTVTNLRTAVSLAEKSEAAGGVFGIGRSPRPANNILNLAIAPKDHAAEPMRLQREDIRIASYHLDRIVRADNC